MSAAVAQQLDVRQVCGLIDLLYQGIEDQRAWPEFLTRSADALGASSAQFFSNGAIGCEGFWLPHNVEPGALQRYEAHFRRLDSWYAARPRLAPGQWALLRTEELVPDEIFLHSEFYHDFLRPQGIRWGRLCLVAPPAPGASEYLLSYYRPANRACFGVREEALIAEFGRHLSRIEQIGAASAQARARAQDPGCAVFLLTEFGGLIQCNEEAEELRRNGLVAAEPWGLRFSSQELNLWLYAALHPRGRSADASASPRLTSRWEPIGPVELELRTATPVVSSPLLRVARRTLTVRPLHRQQGAGAIREATRRYRWTSAEADAAARLAAGATVTAIAATRRISVETVRSHLKAAKRKAGVSRQADLVRLIVRIASGADGES